MLDTKPIEERLAAATPGPWGSVDFSGAMFCGFNDNAPAEPSTFEDAVFIANAPTDIAALLAEVKRLREIEAKYEALCK